jgi:hypothetical protein
VLNFGRKKFWYVIKKSSCKKTSLYYFLLLQYYRAIANCGYFIFPVVDTMFLIQNYDKNGTYRRIFLNICDYDKKYIHIYKKTCVEMKHYILSDNLIWLLASEAPEHVSQIKEFKLRIMANPTFVYY